MKKLVLMACVMSAMIFASCGDKVADVKKAAETLKTVVESKDVACDKLTPAIKTFDEAIKAADTASIKDDAVKKTIKDVAKLAKDKKAALGCND